MAIACIPRGLAILGVLCAAPAAALEFETHRVQGLLNLDLSYGIAYRVNDANDSLIAFASGGTSSNVNGDDGELNYNAGLISQMVRGTGELIVVFGNFGLYARGAAFHDWVQDEHLDRTALTSQGQDLVGSDTKLLDHYLAGNFTVAGAPVHFRLGDQVLTWSTTSYLRDGLDLVNPVELSAAFQPAAQAIDARNPQGMFWIAASLSEIIAVEAYYQYEWKPMVLPPVGSNYSTVDLFGGDGLNAAFLGGGRYSDLGTDLDVAFALPPGTLGYDVDFDRIPGVSVQHPDDGGQYGASVFARFLDGRATQIGLHYMRYHSRLPYLSSITGDAAAIADTSNAQVDALAAGLIDPYVGTGLTPAAAATAARDTAEAVRLSSYANAAGLLEVFPEDIDALGVSFSFGSVRSGVLVSGDIVHHRNFPNQIDIGTVLGATLSPVLFNPLIGTTPLGEYGAEAVVSGYRRSPRTQSVLGLSWVAGPRLGGQQSLVAVDVGWVHIDDLPDRSEAQLASIAPRSDDAWGFRIIGAVTYNSVFGGVNLSPRVLFAADVDGVTPAPSATFVEGRRIWSFGVSGDYLQRLDADLSYTRFSGAGHANLLRDRDYVQLRLTYSF